MSTEVLALCVALVFAGAYITYLHTRVTHYRKVAYAVAAMLQYTIDALDEQTEEEDV